MVTYRNHPITEVFPALSDSDYETLKQDIKENGLLEPIWIDAKNRVIDGRHRLRACRELKIKPEFQETEYTENDIPGIVVGLNLRRRHLNETQRAWVAAQLVPYFEKVESGSENPGTEKPNENTDEAQVSANFPKKSGKKDKRIQRKTATKAAAVVGVSCRSVEDANRVLKDGCDELNQALARGDVAVSDAAKVAKETKATQKKLVKMVQKGEAKHLKQALRIVKQAEQIKQIEAMDPAQGGYPVVVADPAWPYEARKQDSTQRGQTPYPQMTLNDICRIAIPAAEDSILFLWVTNSHLVNGNAARVCGAWGYQPKTLLTWVKNRMGTGDWARSQTEHVVMAVRGQPKLKEVPSTVFEAAVGKHSQKPEAFYQLVERCTAGSKIELFARQDREGWFCHGHAVNQPIASEAEAPVVAEASEEPCSEPEGPQEPVDLPIEEPTDKLDDEFVPAPGLLAPMPVLPPVPEIPQERLDALQEKMKGRKKNPPKVLVMKPTEGELELAMKEAQEAEAQARADELS